jgi:hypothetical protein
MVKEQAKEISWPKVAAKTEELSGIPRKQIDDVSSQIVLGIEALSLENQPKRDGDELVIDTPFAIYKFIREAAENMVGPDGKTAFTRPSCISGNTSIPRNFVIKANVGLAERAGDGAAAEAEKKKKAV